MQTGMWVLACSPGPLPNVSPYMVPMCVLVGAGLSESHVYCVHRSCVRVSTCSDGMASVNQNGCCFDDHFNNALYHSKTQESQLNEDSSCIRLLIKGES